MNIMYRRLDGSFIVQLNGHPYHVVSSDPIYDGVAEIAEGKTYPQEPGISMPQPPPAQSVTNAQARAALIQAGLFDDVQALIESANNPILTTAWEYANTIDRDGVFVTMLKGELGLSEQQLNDLFTAAAAIQF